MTKYRILNKQEFSLGEYSIVPIRMEDRYRIMEWRNEQMYHLRQNEPLTEEKQDIYFESVISNLFDEDNPSQILFSYLKGDKCIGYGGLVHINWVDRNAEISFVMKTSLEKKFFEFHWSKFLNLVEDVAFNQLELHKIFTYAFDLRPRLYNALSVAGFNEDARLSEHCFFENKFIDVLIHTKIASKITFRNALRTDAQILYEWVNEKGVRENSLDSNKIKWQDHQEWLHKRIGSSNSKIFIFFDGKLPIGQVRLDFENDYWVIDYSVDTSFRGKGYGSFILQQIINLPEFKKFKAIVKATNIGSIKVFNKLKFAPSEVKILNKNEVIEFKKEI